MGTEEKEEEEEEEEEDFITSATGEACACNSRRAQVD